jgi:hypothetical protein
MLRIFVKQSVNVLLFFPLNSCGPELLFLGLFADIFASPSCSRIQSNVEGLYLTDGVPFSCCNPHSPRPCLQSRLSDLYAHPLFDPRQPNLNLWAQGCHEVLLGHLQGLSNTLGSILAVTFLLQVSQQSALGPLPIWDPALPPA